MVADAKALWSEVLLLCPPLLELTIKASHLLIAFSLKDLLLIEAPSLRGCMPSIPALELQALAFLQPLLFTPLPHLQVV
jgi:hypothetical protein